jgi:chemotaxis protein MotB
MKTTMKTTKWTLWMGLVLATSACGVSKAKHQSALDELAKAQQDNAALATENQAKQTKITELEGQVANVAGERDRAESEKTGAQKQAAATQKEVEELRKQKAETERRLETFRDLTRRFQKMVDSGRIKVVTRKGRMIMQLPSGILFASGKADLSKEGKIALAEVAAILMQFNDRQFLVAGHTDADALPKGGKWKDNWELSAARAVTVTKTLIDEGVKPENLSAAGYGEFDPIAPNTDEASKQQNRRIEIVLQPNVSELPSLAPAK